MNEDEALILETTPNLAALNGEEWERAARQLRAESHRFDEIAALIEADGYPCPREESE